MNPLRDMPVAVLRAFNVPEDMIHRTVSFQLSCHVNEIPVLAIETVALDQNGPRFDSMRHQFQLDPAPHGFRIVDHPPTSKDPTE